VSETEVGDGAGVYEVEVRLNGGKQVEVELDAGFAVVASETDDDGPGDDGPGDDDETNGSAEPDD